MIGSTADQSLTRADERGGRSRFQMSRFQVPIPLHFLKLVIRVATDHAHPSPFIFDWALLAREPVSRDRNGWDMTYSALLQGQEARNEATQEMRMGGDDYDYKTKGRKDTYND